MKRNCYYYWKSSKYYAKPNFISEYYSYITHKITTGENKNIN